jgi:uncharacterized protein (DUF885 family)
MVDGGLEWWGNVMDDRRAPPWEHDATRLVETYVAAYYAFHPHSAIWDGQHQCDGAVPDFSPLAIRRRISDLERFGEQIHDLQMVRGEAATDGHSSPALRTPEARDLARVEHARRYELFRWSDWRPHTLDPAYYHSPLDVSIYVKRAYAPPAERAEALTRHLRGIPEVLATAYENLRTPLPRPALEHALHVYTGVADYYDRELRAAGLAMTAGEADARALQAALATAIAAVREFVSYLRDQMAEPPGDFRLGSALLASILREAELVDLPLQSVRALALEDLARNRARRDELAARMELSGPAALEALARHHFQADQVLTATATAVAELDTFLAANGLLDMDVAREVPCLIEETPLFMRSGSAFVDAPGPFEQPGLPAYFYVTLPDPEWPASAREGWLRKLNPWGLRNTAAHEAYPGHLLHFLHLARNRSDAARAFTSNATIEGWAHYGEHMVLEAGYGAGDPRVEMAQVTMALLRDCRCIVALDLHAGNASLREAADFIADQTYMAPIRCRQEAQRGAQDPGYLCYTIGKLMLLKLRADYQRQEGLRYTPRRFHDAFLACGAPPLPLARRMLLHDTGVSPL